MIDAVHWIGSNNPASNGGDWSEAAKWSTGAVPNPTDNVFIDAPGTYTVTSNAPVSIHFLSVSSNAKLNITNSSTFSLTSASDTSLSNAGEITINTGSKLLVDAPTLSLNGAGKVTLAGGTITGFAGTEIFDNVDNTIIGNGSITHLTLNNYGDIAAAGANELVLDTGTNAITNEAGGVLEAKSGATLEIVSNVTNVNATTSIIKADDGGIVELVADTITGGTIALNSAGAATALQIEGTVTLSDTTTTTLSNFAQNTISAPATKLWASPSWSITAPSAASAASATALPI